MIQEEPVAPRTVEEGILEVFYQGEVHQEINLKRQDEFEQKLTTLVMKMSVLDEKLNLLKQGNVEVMLGMQHMEAAILHGLLNHQHQCRLCFPTTETTPIITADSALP